MPDQRIDQLNAETTPAAADVLPVFSIAGSDTKKITVKDLVQQGAALVDDASIPVAKVNLSGISGTNLTAGTVAASKLDTSTIPATGGVTVSSSNLQLVAPTTPIVRNAGTGSLEHANSGVTAGTYTKVTVDSKGHVTVGALLVGADLPVATSSVVGGVSIPAAGGLALTGGGALSHSNSVAGGASTRSGITYDLQGHIVSTAALVAADLPVATNAVKGAVIAGGGLAIDGSGIVSVNVATTTDVGGIKIGSEFGLNGSNQLLLATQASVAGGTAYPKVTVNSKGVVTAGASLTSADIPALDTTKITSGTLGIDRYGANTITGAKLANYATGKISEAFPTADYISQLFFNPLDRTLYMWDGNVYQPIGVSYGQVVFSGTYDAGTNLIASVTTEGAAIGLTVGGALVSPVTATKGHYVVVDQPGTGTAPAPTISLSPPDMLLSNGTTWVLLDVSDTVTAQLASNIQVSPAGNIASTNVQSALQELDDEKLPLAGGTLTGNLALNTGIAIVYEGATTDNFETTLYVVNPTADRTILLPNVSGTVVTTGDTGTVTSTMLLDGTILNEDINASAAIVDTKLATIATAGKVSNSATTAASANTASAIVARDASGNFTAGTITAALTGAASSNVLKAGDTMTGALVHPLGAAATPSLTFTGDLNTGIFSPGADQVAVATNGTGRLFIDDQGRVGVGITPGTGGLNFDVRGIALSSNPTLGVTAFDFVSGSSFTGTFIRQAGSTATGSTSGLSNASLGSLTFQNVSAGLIRANGSVPIVFATTDAERLRITSAGLVGIGTSSPAYKLDVVVASSKGIGGFAPASSAGISDFSAGGVGWTFTRPNGTYIHSIYSYDTAAGAKNNFVIQSRNDIVFTYGGDHTNSLESMRIDSAGRVGIGTTSPAAALDVSKSSNNLGLTEILRLGGTAIASNDGWKLSFYQTTVGEHGYVGAYYVGGSTWNGVLNGASNFEFRTGGTERARIDSSGRLLVGTSNARTLLSQSMGIQIETTDYPACGLSIVNNQNADANPLLLIGKSRGATLNSNTIVQSGDTLGEIHFLGADGSAMLRAASIRCLVDGTPGANDMPGRLVFSTTADGASSPTERVRIKSSGAISFGQGNTGPGSGVAGTLINAGDGGILITINTEPFLRCYTLNGGFPDALQIANNGNVTNANNSYGAISDVKLKENIVDATSQWNDLKALQVRKYNFKEGQTHTQIGLVAQEVELVSPGLVTESPDRDAEGNDLGTVTKSVNYSVLYMKAVKALQEAMERIETLEQRLTAAGID